MEANEGFFLLPGIQNVLQLNKTNYFSLNLLLSITKLLNQVNLVFKHPIQFLMSVLLAMYFYALALNWQMTWHYFRQLCFNTVWWTLLGKMSHSKARYFQIMIMRKIPPH